MFFVREDLPVNSTLGTLSVIGDVEEDVVLTLEDPENSPVELSLGENGTMVLVLRAPLDKEGVDGLASIHTAVVCTRVNSTDPGYTVPVSIR